MSSLQKNNGFLQELVLWGKKRHLHFCESFLSGLNVKTTFDAYIIILNFSLGIFQLSQNGCKAWYQVSENVISRPMESPRTFQGLMKQKSFSE